MLRGGFLAAVSSILQKVISHRELDKLLLCTSAQQNLQIDRLGVCTDIHLDWKALERSKLAEVAGMLRLGRLPKRVRHLLLYSIIKHVKMLD